MAFGLSIKCLTVDQWTKSILALLCDRRSTTLVQELVIDIAPHRDILRALPTFESLFSLTICEIKHEVVFGELCPPHLKNLSVSHCTVSTADPNPPKALEGLSLYECEVMLGPKWKLCSLLNCDDCAIATCMFTRCTFRDLHKTWAWPTSSPKLASLAFFDCLYSSGSKKVDLFTPVSLSLKEVRICRGAYLDAQLEHNKWEPLLEICSY